MPDKGSFETPQTGGTGKKNVHRVDVGVKDCTIRSVVVFKDRAEVKRVVLASLVAGENEIIIGGLAECVDKNSIRYGGFTTTFTILFSSYPASALHHTLATPKFRDPAKMLIPGLQWGQGFHTGFVPGGEEGGM